MKFAQGDRVRITAGSCKGLEGTVWSVANNGSCEVVFNRNLSDGFTEDQMEFCEGHPAEGFENVTEAHFFAFNSYPSHLLDCKFESNRDFSKGVE